MQRIKFHKGEEHKRRWIDEYSRLTTSLPSPAEQSKIAAFLSAVDDRISQLEGKFELLKEYKQGVAEKIFGLEIRFQSADGKSFPAWNSIHLSDITTRVRTKNKEGNQNVLTISAQHGLIRQKDFFDASVAAKDLTGC